MIKVSTEESVDEKDVTQKKKKKKNKNKTPTKLSDQTTNEIPRETTSGLSKIDIKPSQEKKSAKPTKKKQNVTSNQKSNNVIVAIKKFSDKHKKSKDLKKVAHKTIDKNKSSNGISVERLKAFGINPKKFAKKQKYGQKSALQPDDTTQNSKNARKENTKNVQKAKYNSKLRNKLKKALKA